MTDKAKYKIKYEYQIIIPLMYLREHSNNDESVEITRFQMIDYRVKTAQEFAYNNIIVEYETGIDAFPRFIKEFSKYIEIIETNEDMIFRLKSNFNEEIYHTMLRKVEEEVKSVLTNKEIIKSTLYEKSL